MSTSTMHGRPTLRVLAKPAYANPVNPYNALLYDAIIDLGSVEIREHQYATPPWTCDIYHSHWPEVIPVYRKPRALLKPLIEWSWLLLARLMGVKLVWTAHNAFPHDLKPTGLNLFLWRRFLSLVDGVIFLSETSRQAILNENPSLKSIPWAVINHGHYLPWLNSVRDAPRKPIPAIEHLINCNKGHFVILTFGQLLRYKNIDSLLVEFTKLPDKNVRLIVAGAAKDQSYAEDLREIAKLDNRIMLHVGHLDDPSLVKALDNADLVVLPYKKMLNSGAAILALSTGTHVLAPAIGSLPLIQEQVGSNAITLYNGAINTETISSTIQRVKAGFTSLPNLQEFEWPHIAKETVAFYDMINTFRAKL